MSPQRAGTCRRRRFPGDRARCSILLRDGRCAGQISQSQTEDGPKPAAMPGICAVVADGGCQSGGGRRGARPLHPNVRLVWRRCPTDEIFDDAAFYPLWRCLKRAGGGIKSRHFCQRQPGTSGMWKSLAIEGQEDGKDDLCGSKLCDAATVGTDGLTIFIRRIRTWMRTADFGGTGGGFGSGRSFRLVGFRCATGSGAFALGKRQRR